MDSVPGLGRRLNLQTLIFLLLLLSGILPLVAISYLLISQNREILETQEKSFLTRSAQSISSRFNEGFVSVRKQARQVGSALLETPGPRDLSARLRQPWVADYLQDFLVSDPDLMAVRVLDRQGQGPRLAPRDLLAATSGAMDAAFEQALGHDGPVYRLATVSEVLDDPLAVLAMPVGPREGLGPVFVEVLFRVPLIGSETMRQAGPDLSVYLIDKGGSVMWSRGATAEMETELEASAPVRDFARVPLSLTIETTMELGGELVPALVQVSPIAEAEWGLVLQKPVSGAFPAVQTMIVKTLLLSAVLLAVALALAMWSARRITLPIRQLAATSQEIASGKLGQRVEASGLGAEIQLLAESFNSMSSQVQDNVEQLRQSAIANRELFIGSIRAFAATIDAKDPYTKGHAERVAEYSRKLAVRMELSPEMQQRIWVGALLHDIGKIGIDEQILRKGGVLTAEEYEQMKRHPVIGAEILSPIEDLREMIPAVRWHHEAWNGQGYPDGLKGEQIPLIARIVAIADSFDAITINRPYQQASSPREAVAILTKLGGMRFDPKVTAVFLAAFESGEIVVRQAAAAPREERLSQPVRIG